MTSVLRLATDVPLANDSEWRTTHRIDIPINYCENGLCDVRNTIGDLLMESRQPNLVFTHLLLNRSKVLQKYYKVSNHIVNSNRNRNRNRNPNSNEVSTLVGDAVVEPIPDIPCDCFEARSLPDSPNC